MPTFSNAAGTLISSHARAADVFSNPKAGLFPVRSVNQGVYDDVQSVSSSQMNAVTLKNTVMNFGTVGAWSVLTYRIMREYIQTLVPEIRDEWVAHYWWVLNPTLHVANYDAYDLVEMRQWSDHMLSMPTANGTNTENTGTWTFHGLAQPTVSTTLEPTGYTSSEEEFNAKLYNTCRANLVKDLGNYYGVNSTAGYFDAAIGFYRDEKEAGWLALRTLGGSGPGAMTEVHKEMVWNMAVKFEKEKKKVPVVSILEMPFKKAFANYKKVKAVKGEIGLEIEAEGENLFNSPIQYWHAVADGSLRSYKGHDPLEYVLREPLPRDQVKEALEYLSNRLKGAKSRLVMSHRCSVHVHVNCQPMKVKDLINYMALYYIFEDTLVGWAAPERRGNLFALRAKDAEYQVELLTQALKQGTWGQLFNTEYRYGAMNVSSLSVHGSLEFRAMRGTVDIQTISDWVTILLALKDAASEFKTPESISRMFKSMGPRGFMIHVLDGRIPPKILKDFLAGDTTFTEMWDGYREVRDVLHAVDWNDPPSHMFKAVSTKIKTLMPNLDLE